MAYPRRALKSSLPIYSFALCDGAHRTRGLARAVSKDHLRRWLEAQHPEKGAIEHITLLSER